MTATDAPPDAHGLPPVAAPSSPDPPARAVPWPAVTTVAALAVGVSLRLLTFLSDRPLWIDEAMLALNVVDRSPARLLDPLDHDQAAPVGFLLLMKLAVSALGPTEGALRLVPLIGSVGGLLAFAVAAFRWLPGRSARLAVAAFAASPAVVSYAGEAKQYSTDAAVAAGLLAVAAPLFRHPTRGRWWAVGLAGAVAVWCSHPAVFVLGGVGVAAGVDALRGRRSVRPVLAVAAAWLASFAGVYRVNLHHTTDNGGLSEYWAAHFLPTSASAGPWLVEHLVDLFHTAGGYGGETFRAAGLAAGLAAVGVLALRRDGRRAEVLAVGATVGLVVLAAGAGKYPFHGRLLLFLAPAATLLVARGATAVADGLAHWSQAAAVGVVGVVVAAPLAQAVQDLRTPPRTEDLPAALRFVRQRWQPGDRVYVYGGSGDAGAGPAFRFYNRGGAVPADAVIRGGVFRGDPRRYRDEVLAVRPPGRVWVLFSHRHKDEEAVIRGHFDAVGEPGAEFRGTGAAVYEYALTGPAAPTPSPSRGEGE
jgi:hypothetical protein